LLFMRESRYASPFFNITGIVSLILFIGTFIYLSFVSSENEKMERELEEKMLESEMRLSEKLEQEKQNEELVHQLKIARNDLTATTRSLFQAAENLSLSEAKLREMENAAFGSKHVKDLQLRILQLRQRNHNDSSDRANRLFEVEMENETHKQLVHDRLFEKTAYIEKIDDLSRARINNILVEPLSRTNKLVSKASRVRKLTVNVQVAEKLTDLSFTVMDPEGKALPTNQNNSAINQVKSNVLPHAFYIAPDITLGVLEPKKEVKLVYVPSTKLKPGTYQVNLISKKDTIANIRLRLR
jgi:hypothetical protein